MLDDTIMSSDGPDLLGPAADLALDGLPPDALDDGAPPVAPVIPYVALDYPLNLRPDDGNDYGFHLTHYYDESTNELERGDLEYLINKSRAGLVGLLPTREDIAAGGDGILVRQRKTAALEGLITNARELLAIRAAWALDAARDDVKYIERHNRSLGAREKAANYNNAFGMSDKYSNDQQLNLRKPRQYGPYVPPRGRRVINQLANISYSTAENIQRQEEENNPANYRIGNDPDKTANAMKINADNMTAANSGYNWKAVTAAAARRAQKHLGYKSILGHQLQESIDNVNKKATPPSNFNIKSDKFTMTTDNIQSWCKEKNLSYHLIDLSKLEEANSKYSFVHTGTNKNEYNNGYNNHYLFLFGKYLFDSYSYQSHYKLPKWIIPVTLNPPRLQEFGSSVCGEYCCVFYRFVYSIIENSEDESTFSSLGIDFCKHFNMSTNRKENDLIIVENFKS